MQYENGGDSTKREVFQGHGEIKQLHTRVP